MGEPKRNFNIEKLRRGDKAEWNLCVRVMKKQIRYKWHRSFRTPCPSEICEDILQDTSKALWFHIKNQKEIKKSLYSLLNGITHNKTVNAIDEHIKKFIPDRLDGENEDSENEGYKNVVADKKEDTSQLIKNREFREAYWDCLNRLEKIDMVCFRYRFEDKEKFDVIRQLVESRNLIGKVLSTSAIEKRVKKAQRIMRNCLKEKEFCSDDK